MLQVHVPSVGPEAADPERSLEKGHMVFRVEVLCNGRRHTIHRRYSEFHALHKQIKKSCKVPDFPPKRVPNWRPKVLEQRRQGLEAYIQGVLYLNQEVPKEMLEFLKLRHFPSDPKTSSMDTQLPHRPVVSFHRDPYIQSPLESIPNMVVSGVLQGFYGYSGCTTVTQLKDSHFIPSQLHPGP
ncbi:sorting nexin-22 isoform X1 [Sarcophilus harrisii]|uniref:Sorting nexin 22 n=1 Tax=Sarcophilus harrisii TaxID=9305 RepID=A0A7N4PLQ3_SARHA|nr:sorting nexin-22 isoform X1 [Sarcophilus harrisii]